MIYSKKTRKVYFRMRNVDYLKKAPKSYQRVHIICIYNKGKEGAEDRLPKQKQRKGERRSPTPSTTKRKGKFIPSK